MQLFAQLAIHTGKPMFQWTATEGLCRLEADFGSQALTANPIDVLKHIKANSLESLYVLLDFHPYLDDPIHVRLIKEIAQKHEAISRTLVFISHDFKTPPELSHLTTHFELHLPDKAAIHRLIREEARTWQKNNDNKKLQVDKTAVAHLTENLLGTTSTDAKRLIRTAIYDDGAISHNDLPVVMKAKYDLMNRDGVISFEYDTAKFSDIAGLNKLKQWLTQRKKAFHGKGSNMDKPKGIMLLGVQGSGKSLAAKSVAGTFGLPLLRLDFGALYNKFYGETEKNLREALKTADTMSPCVLWVDEIEKSLSSDSSDSGVSQRILGTLLTWMAERKSSVFIVATSNDIERLPPELVRKGRLDEVFFVDLPDLETRKDIFEIHFRQRNLAPSSFDLIQLAESSEGFSGAEIEQSIVASLYASQGLGQKLDTQHLLIELEQTQPLSVVMAEKINQLRAWASNRTVPAH